MCYIHNYHNICTDLSLHWFQGSTIWETKTDEELLAEFELEESNSFNKVPPKHDGCWDLEKRGGVGETPTHLLYLMDSAEHSEVAKILLNMFPKLACDYYEADEYYGKFIFPLTYYLIQVK